MSNEYLDSYNATLAHGLRRRDEIKAKYGADFYRRYETMAEEDRRDSLYLPWDERLMGVAQPNAGRDEHLHRYAWAVPTDEALDLIARVAAGRGVVEIGAGNGYWAKLLSERGVDIRAFDLEPYVPYGRAIRGSEGEMPRWFPVEEASATIAGKFPDRVLFLCWPPYADPMAYNALKAYEATGGDTLIYIGEGGSGCTGDDTFHELLCTGPDEWHKSMGDGESFFSEVDPCDCGRAWIQTEELDIPQWAGLHDSLYVYRRLTTPTTGDLLDRRRPDS